jgi:hypothetical protein
VASTQERIKNSKTERHKLQDDNIEEIRDLQRRYAAIPNPSPITETDVLGYDDFGISTK